MSKKPREIILSGMFEFEISATDTTCAARCGRFHTPHGNIETPVFMPVGTCATVKGVTADQLHACGSQIILANTYHLLLRPGPRTVRALGGVHRMMAWDKPILTDSGGYQVFSLSGMRKINEQAVTFRSHIDGSTVELSPERAIEVQQALGSDIMMQLDVCPPHDADLSVISDAVELSARWAKRCLHAAESSGQSQALFAIQQGGTDMKLRARSAELLTQLDLPGFAIGGLSVGEGHKAMMGTLDEADSWLPREKPRYLMGVGEVRDIIGAVARGIDMFDCVMPTRNGRNSFAFTFDGPLKLRNAKHETDNSPLEPDCPCPACQMYSRGTIRHLFMVREMLGPILLSIHNITFFARLMALLRQAIAEGEYAEVASSIIARYYGDEKECLLWPNHTSPIR